MPVIGFLHPGFPDLSAPSFDALRQGLRDAGLGADETIKIEARWARGKPTTLAQMAQELVQLRVALLVVTARPSIEAARAATIELPIVANDLESDPVASGYVKSLAHPGAILPAPSSMHRAFVASGCSRYWTSYRTQRRLPCSGT